MPLTWSDVEQEFADIASEADHLSRCLSLTTTHDMSDDGQRAWEIALICASATEKIYTGCERVMAMLARKVDGAEVFRSERWHSTLLRRMANPVPGVREAIVSPSCYGQLDRLRTFRHFERNSFGIHLDGTIVIERRQEAIAAFQVFSDEVAAFLKAEQPPS